MKGVIKMKKSNLVMSIVYFLVGVVLILRSVYKELHADRETGC